MATIAQSFSGSRAAKAPISAHPAFPAIVALWFAALLGLGSLVLPVALIEKLVTVTRIASLIPGAEPPLGFTARAGIALAASITGALVGLSLARRVAAASAPDQAFRSFSLSSERQCRPISAHDELGEEGLDSADSAAAPLVHRRRSLAMAEDNRPSAYLQAVPLPGHSANERVEPMMQESPSQEETLAEEAVAEVDFEPLDLGAFASPEDDPAEAELDDGLETLRRRIHTPDASGTQDSPMTDQIFQPTALEPERGQDDPLPFAAPSLRRSLSAAFDEDEADETELVQENEAEEAPIAGPFADEPAPQLTVVEPDGETDADDRPVEELGLVQLAARLGASIEKRRAWLAERQSVAPPAPRPIAPFGDADDFEFAEPDEAARAIADFFGPATAGKPDEAAETYEATAMQPVPVAFDETPARAAMPDSLRGLSLEQDGDDVDDTIAASFSLPLAGALSGVDEPSDDEAEQFDEEDPEDGDYSSLLAMKNPFARQQEFVRIDEPEEDDGSIEPAVTFPSPSLAAREESDEPHAHASAARPFDPPKKPVESALRPAPPATPRDPSDAERSLRDALATLQRMSGAA